jgi:uncharacterized protein
MCDDGSDASDADRSLAVVLDTNVLVAAGFNPRSASARIVDAVKSGRIRMVWNDATRREIERIIHQIPPLRARGVKGLFRSGAHIPYATHPQRFGFIPDPDDRKFAALAEAAGAVLISSDGHLLSYRALMPVPVLTPGKYWRQEGWR